MRPIIGITTYVEPASWTVWRDLPAVLIPQAYVEAVTLAGGRPILLPPDDQDADIVNVLDGLVLSGGADVAPGLYGAAPERKTVTRPDRDAGEMLLLHRALETDTPVLGICRGMQQLVVAAGGRLHQHLPDLPGSWARPLSCIAITTRASPTPDRSSSPPRPTTGCRKRSKIRPAGSSSACNGTPK
jgi:putative glutamine amidotransferase